jgi:hypothetical protein
VREEGARKVRASQDRGSAAGFPFRSFGAFLLGCSARLVR